MRKQATENAVERTLGLVEMLTKGNVELSTKVLLVAAAALVKDQDKYLRLAAEAFSVLSAAREPDEPEEPAP